MKHHFINILLIGNLIACTSISQNTSTTKYSNDRPDSDDLIHFEIEAIDLSEDMSRLSTKNDEVILFVYEFTQNKELNQPLYVEKFILDLDRRSKNFQISKKDMINRDLILILIEQDSEASIEQIDPVLRIHIDEIIDAYEARNYSGIEKYIADDDILGIKLIEDFVCTSKLKFRFSDTYKMDRYDYLVNINC